MNERQTKALNDLYMATVEVLNAFAPEMVTAEMRRETVARMLDNFLSGMYAGGNTTGGNSGGGNRPDEPKGNEPQPDKDPDKKSDVEDIITDPEPPKPPIQPEPKPEGEVRYAQAPVGGAFKRLKDADARAEILQSDPEAVFFYKFYITDESGCFEISPLDGMQVKELIARASELLDGVAEVVPESEKADTATRVVTVQRGEVVKNGRSWEITRPARIKYVS